MKETQEAQNEVVSSGRSMGLKEMAKLQKLETLLFSGTQITDAGLKEVAKLERLEYLYLSDTQVTEAGVAELKKALPSCKIEGP